MFLKFNLQFYFSFLFLPLLLPQGGKNIKIQQLSNNFISSVKQSRETHQIIQIVDGNLKNDNFLEFIVEVEKNFPSYLIDKGTIADEGGNNFMPPLYETRASIFVIFASNRNLSQLSGTFKFIEYLCQSNARSKILIVHDDNQKEKTRDFNDAKQYLQFFEKMWSEQFLDVTVLELSPAGKIGNNLSSLSGNDATIHYYNPFSKTYYQKRITDCNFDQNSTTDDNSQKDRRPKNVDCELFPDKLENLHNYQMIIGVFHYPPYVNVELNSEGNIHSVTGPDIKGLEVLSKFVSFSIRYQFSNQTNWDKISCTKGKNIGITNLTMHNKVQMIALEGINFVSCLRTFTVTGRGIRLFRYIHLVPILPAVAEPLSNNWQFLNLLSVIILLVLPWITAKLLHFDIDNWRIINNLQMVLSMSAPREPTSSVERIVFACMLISCFLESSYIFSAFSSSQLQMESFLKLETFGDLLKTSLKPMIAVNLLKPVTNMTDDFDRLLSRTIGYDGPPSECARLLKRDRNISCVMRETQAQLIVFGDKDQLGRSSMKILNMEIMWLYSSTIILAGGSPFRDRFDGIMLRLVQSGIGKKWDDDQFQRNDHGPSQLELFRLESSQTTSIMIQLLQLLIIGWLCSFLAFLAEIIVHLYRKRGRRVQNKK